MVKVGRFRLSSGIRGTATRCTKGMMRPAGIEVS